MNAKIISLHQTKKAAHSAGRALRAAGQMVFVMSAPDFVRFHGQAVVGWVVFA